jgi:hypothetical protein
MHAPLSDKTLRCRTLHSEMMQQATKPSIGFWFMPKTRNSYILDMI